MKSILSTQSNVKVLPSQIGCDSFPRTYAARPNGSFESFVLDRSEFCVDRLRLTAEKRDGSGTLEAELLTPAEADDFVKTPVRLRGNAFQKLLKQTLLKRCAFVL